MHITSIIAICSLVTLTFGNPIILPSITTALDHYPTSTATYSHTKSTNTHHVHSTHTFVRPTGTYHPSSFYAPIHHPIATPPSDISAREAKGVPTPDSWAGQPNPGWKGCLDYGYDGERLWCTKWGYKREAAAEDEFLVERDDELMVRDAEAVDVVFVLEGRDGEATDDQCQEACFWNSCECINAAGAVTIKMLFVLAMAGAALLLVV